MLWYTAGDMSPDALDRIAPSLPAMPAPSAWARHPAAPSAGACHPPPTPRPTGKPAENRGRRAVHRPACLVVEAYEGSTTVESAVVSFSAASQPAILESTRPGERSGRYSILTCEPIEVFTAGRCDDAGVFDALAERIRRFPAVSAPGWEVPFCGGWIGFFSYEAGLALESVASGKAANGPLPAIRFGLYDSAAVFDHQQQRWFLVAVDWPTGIAVQRPPVADRLARLRQRLAEAWACPLEPVHTGWKPVLHDGWKPVPHDGWKPVRVGSLRPNMSYGGYVDRVRRAIGYIEAGDIYQANVTLRWTVETDASATTLYRRLRRCNPAPYAALLRWDDVAVLSSSPELFLRLRDGHVVTRPIKGTRPRTGDGRRDDRYRSELAASEKDHAELAMIVDLLRNDLGRVCSYGSVVVTAAGDIEAHPTVFHRVATVEGRLAPGRNWLDLIKATLPCGSVTGAPKIRATQVIAELEPTPRGVYCGAIGVIGLDGGVTLNVAIRTMVQTGSSVHVYAGGAIVADSEPHDEYQEALAKARGMFSALGWSPPDSALSTA
ncbi:MAG: anthranilate synthase component I family protein [Phycisphaerae bacterium]